jgi:BirA family biotin operon repressor/biotin-[acetyl-CoA-carboxylase] ligase
MARLSPDTEALGFRLLALAETGSTNEDALQAARDGDPGRLWIVADRQTAGRGRHGRAWASPEGNLHATLLLVDPCAMRDGAQLGFVAGLALHDAAADLLGEERGLGLKWPNDLLLDGAKLAGILLEATSVGPGRMLAVAIGCGVNVAGAPQGTPYPATCLAVHAPLVDRDALFERFSARFAARLLAWDRGAGFAALRRDWLARAAGLGAEIRVRLPTGDLAGRFTDLDEHGRLLLQQPGGLVSLDAGDLFFPNLLRTSDVRTSAVSKD